MIPFRASLLCSTAATVAAALITNPGAETGSMTGWTQDSGGPASAINTAYSGTGGAPGPRSGSYYFVAAASATSSVFSQIVNVPSEYHSDIDAGLIAVELTAYNAGYLSNTDTGSLILECQDSGGSVLASYSAINLAVSVDLTWYKRAAKIAAPSGTRKIRVGTTNTRNLGTVLDSYWDDFDLVLTTLKTLWTNSGGTGNRTGSITVSATNITTGGGALSDLVNGALANSYWWTNATGNGTGYLTFDFGSAKVIDAFRWLQETTHSHGTWRFEGSNDNSSWTQIGSDFTLQGDPNNHGGFYWFSNTTAYRYYRLRHMSGSRSQTPYLYEIEFRIV